MFVFKENENHLSSSTKLGNSLQHIGKRTLDIYYLHFYFLPYNLSFVGKWLDKNPNPLLEFSMSLTLALLVVVCCLLVSKIIRISPTLAYLLLGVKHNKKK
jgi:fucose 4-O-acetylase-like acetyltransferase